MHWQIDKNLKRDLSWAVVVIFNFLFQMLSTCSEKKVENLLLHQGAKQTERTFYGAIIKMTCTDNLDSYEIIQRIQ